MTIKLKITLWFTTFMILLSAVVFAFIAFFTSSTASQELRGKLTGLVDKNSREIELDDGELEIDDDFVSFKDGIHCLIFDQDGSKITGYSPDGMLEREPFRDGAIRQVQVGLEPYLLYDRLLPVSRSKSIWLRGIVPERGGGVDTAAVNRAVLIALPLLIVLAAVGGYLIAGRSLQPIKEIGKTAEEISKSGDLSKRIAVDGSGDELQRLAEIFNRMFERLEANFELQQHFTSDASHELRTPLSVILAQCEYALEDVTGKEELYELIGVIQKQGYRMSHLIESLLSFTRMEQRTEAYSFTRIDLSALVLSVCREQEGSGERGITLTGEIQPGIFLKADGALIVRLLENLIRNGYRYGRERGKIRVSLSEAGGTVRLSVADDGIGIAGDELPKIWNRFYRVERSRSAAKGKGLGLGLAMVKQIVELHGGRIEVKSEPGWGSVFTVLFKSAG
ncbi:MAG: HAMP domain-containing protein [Firmicutes bacterium]|nr:HAMP domain-containing protein [Bacillota bacterium]